jgi:hypothetical protein
MGIVSSPGGWVLYRTSVHQPDLSVEINLGTGATLEPDRAPGHLPRSGRHWCVLPPESPFHHACACCPTTPLACFTLQAATRSSLTAPPGRDWQTTLRSAWSGRIRRTRCWCSGRRRWVRTRVSRWLARKAGWVKCRSWEGGTHEAYVRKQPRKATAKPKAMGQAEEPGRQYRKRFR